MSRIEKIKNSPTEYLAEFIFEVGDGDEYSCSYCIYGLRDRCPNSYRKQAVCIEGITKWLEQDGYLLFKEAKI